MLVQPRRSLFATWGRLFRANKNGERAVPPVGLSRKGLHRGYVLLSQISVALLFILFWELGHRNGWVPPLLSRSPIEVWQFTVKSFSSGEMQVAAASTMQATLIAFALAAIIGTIAGLILSVIPVLDRAIAPYLDALNAMPRIALAPVFITYFGINQSAKIALAFTLVIFITTFAARVGVQSADHNLVRLSVALGATSKDLILKIYLPVAIPSIFAGFRLGLIFSLLGVVASELIASRAGLGQMVSTFSGQFHMEGVYSVLIILAIIAAAINVVTAAIERRLLRWQPPKEFA